MEDTNHLVSSTHKYSDGTETVVNYVANPDQIEIETKVAEAVASDHKNPDGIETETFEDTEVAETDETKEGDEL